MPGMTEERMGAASILSSDLRDSPCLPKEFFGEHTAELAWLSILGSKRRIKEVADKLRALKIETALPRKQAKTLPDANLLGLYYATATFHSQLMLQTPMQQYDALSARTLTRRFLDELMEARSDELVAILELNSHALIKGRICDLLPEAQDMFDQGWGESTYPPLTLLALLFELAPQLEVNSTRYYQACFALYTVLQDTLNSPLLTLTFQRGRKVPGFREVYGGFERLKSGLDSAMYQHASNSWPLAISLSAALKELSSDVLVTESTSVIKVHELLFSMFGPAHQGLRAAAEEYVAFQLAPRMHWVTSKIRETINTAGIQEGVSTYPDGLGSWELDRRATPISEAHFNALRPLMSIEQRIQSYNWEEQVANIGAKARASTEGRREIHGLTSGASIDPSLITAAAIRLKENALELCSMTNTLISQANDIFAVCHAAKNAWDSLIIPDAEWDSQIDELANQIAPTAHLSDSASQADQEVLEMAFEEARHLKIQLQEARYRLHQQKMKETALSHYQAAAYAGPALEPSLIRKAVSRPSTLTPAEVLMYIQHVAGKVVRILPSAWRAAEDSAHFELSDRMLDLLDRLVFQYAPSLASGKADSEAREIFAGSYSARESETVECSQVLRAERTFEIDGVDHYFCRHLLVGNDPGRVRGMRIHFDILDGIVVIAYAGKHLTVSSTN